MTRTAIRPERKPRNPNFSSGPCAKRPGWSLRALEDPALGRSHRSREGKAKLREVIDLTRDVLGIPADYRIAIVPGSDTGAVEMALWGLLGPRGVDVFAWESFGADWVTDVVKELRIEDRRIFKAAYGDLPDVEQASSDRDVIFTWNGTSSGVRVPNADWIAEDRGGLTICDATSAAFAMDLPWPKLDVTTWSWQKALGGEGAHGMLVLSPRAAERLTSHTPQWPMPKLFRMVQQGVLTEGLFTGETINTPSLLAVEDAIDSLRWAREIGGLSALKARCRDNFSRVEQWLARNPWCDFLASRAEIRSETSIYLKLVDPDLLNDQPRQTEIAAALVARLAQEQVALDAAAYRTAPPGFRFWAGATVEADDLALALEWLSWCYHDLRKGAAS